jgi:fructokinase
VARAGAKQYSAPVRIGVDVGGTKIEAIALLPNGDVLSRLRTPTPQGDYRRTVQSIAGLVVDLERRHGRQGTVGVGIPGTISRATGLVKNANSVWLIGTPLREDLQRLLARPVRFANDANCFALSEAVDGSAAGARVVFGVIIGTGTGGGIVIDGAVVEGVNGIAGEWGHNPLPWPRGGELPGPACYCGRAGCIETYLSGPALAREYQAATLRPVDAAEIAVRAAAGEAEALRCLECYADRFARAVATIINVIDPDVVVLGGGLSNIDQLYEAVPARWSRYIFSDVVTTRLVKAHHGDSSGVRGAAWLWNLA